MVTIPKKIISPADQNFPVLTANDKITWWLRPQTPSENSRLDFLRNDIRITRMIWKSYHSMKNESKKKESWVALGNYLKYLAKYSLKIYGSKFFEEKPLDSLIHSFAVPFPGRR